jgi:calpain-15
MKIRNPWGQKEWKGDYSDKSYLWTEDLKKECGWKDADDGIFFMPFTDYLEYFRAT